MRRVYTVVACTMVFQAMVAPQAQAWWDGVEHMSGPGPFFGWDLQARLFCAVDQIPVNDKGQRDTSQPVETKTFIPTTIGIITSTCRTEEQKTDEKTKQTVKIKHRLSVDVIGRFLWADNDPRFANGQRISLTMFGPSMSIALLNKFDNWDILDYGFGAGAYWFSSTEFASFHGTYLEPGRVEIHAPYNWRKHTWSAAIPRGRVGYFLFPAGFEVASFAAGPGTPVRISRDWVLNGGVDFDLSPLLKKLAP